MFTSVESKDPELGITEADSDNSPSNDKLDENHVLTPKDISRSYWGTLGDWSKKLETLGVEVRGIQPVNLNERSPQSWWGLSILWASAGLNIGTLTTGFLGPYSFNLTFNQTCAIIWGVGALGTCLSASLAPFGKKNGLRAMVNSRFIFGFWGNMVMATLNNVTNVVFGVLSCILGGQILHTMSHGKVSTVVGMIVVGVGSWLIGTCGYKVIHFYERVAWIFPMIVFISLYTIGAPCFATSHPAAEILDSKTQAGLTLSFMSVIFGSFSGWVAVSADYYIYFPITTPSWKIFMMSWLGIFVIPAFAMTCGAGFATSLWINDSWAQNWDENGTVASLVEIVLRPLGQVRYFFLFIFFWANISNNVFGLYSISLTTQVFGSRFLRIPPYVYTFIACVIMVVIAVAGRNNVYTALSDFMAIIGYWCVIFWTIFIEEHLIFKVWGKRGWDLNAWNDRNRLPVGYASSLAFAIGAVGSIMGMSEAWYTGVVGKRIGEFGGDLGVEMGFLFAFCAYPPLRWWEVRVYDR